MYPGLASVRVWLHCVLGTRALALQSMLCLQTAVMTSALENVVFDLNRARRLENFSWRIQAKFKNRRGGWGIGVGGGENFQTSLCQLESS